MVCQALVNCVLLPSLGLSCHMLICPACSYLLLVLRCCCAQAPPFLGAPGVLTRPVATTARLMAGCLTLRRALATCVTCLAAWASTTGEHGDT
jgi:hypothetical protein